MKYNEQKPTGNQTTKSKNDKNSNHKTRSKQKDNGKSQHSDYLQLQKSNNPEEITVQKANLLMNESSDQLEKILGDIQTSLGISAIELKQTLLPMIFSSNPDIQLYEFLGPNFLSEIEFILKNKNQFLKSNQKNQNFYTEIIIPPTPLQTNFYREKNTFKIFPYKYFNPVQSQVLKITQSDNNFLLAAPTGSGKTDVACLCLIQNTLKYTKQKSTQIKSNGSIKKNDC
ncbi:RNA helicase, partial [Pseudoloma neurophilia]